MMHFLVHELRAAGFDAYLIDAYVAGDNSKLEEQPYSTNPAFDTPHAVTSGQSLQEISNDWVLIYPEGVFQNPLNARHVVRYLLGYEGAYTAKGMGADPKDYLITYARLFHQTAEVLYYPVFDSELLIRSGRLGGNEARSLDAYHIGKGLLNGPCPAVEGAVEVTSTWPADKTQLYDLLRQVRIFYSYDWLSSTCADAGLMGCEVRLIGNPGPIRPEDLLKSTGLPVFWQRSSTGSFFFPKESRADFLTSIQEHRAAFGPNLLRTFRNIMEYFSEK